MSSSLKKTTKVTFHIKFNYIPSELVIFGSAISSSVTLPSDGNILRAFILEIVMTFTLVYIVLTTAATASNKIAPLAGLAIGLTLGFNVIFGGSISGGSLNPARSFGPALISGNFSYNWIYWIAPVIGSLIAAGIHRFLHREQDQ
jgi:glycerol uptake facilitator-like aquaporin